jgi:hypothetical protein
LYVFAAIVYGRYTSGVRRVFGIVVTVVLVGLAATFGPRRLGYAAVLLVLGVAWARRPAGPEGRSGRGVLRD